MISKFMIVQFVFLVKKTWVLKDMSSILAYKSSKECK